MIVRVEREWFCRILVYLVFKRWAVGQPYRAASKVRHNARAEVKE
jgi:hypothetical protein